MMTWFTDWWSGGTAVIEPASQRDAARLAQLHGASFHRGWGEGEFEVMLTERNTLVHRLRLGRKIIGFAVSRMAADEAELLSIAIDASQRGRGLSRNLLLTHLGHLAGRGVLLDVARLRTELPLVACFFDCLYRDGTPLVDRPAHFQLPRLPVLSRALIGSAIALVERTIVHLRGELGDALASCRCFVAMTSPRHWR